MSAVQKYMTMVNNQALPPQPLGIQWEQHIADIQSLVLRHDDVMICAYPKGGTHWLWEVCHMLLQGKVEYEKRAKEHLMVEFTSLDAVVKEPSPRIVNTHLVFSSLPVGEIKDKRVKIVHVYRNPKDSAVSMYFHYKQMPQFGSKTTGEFFQEFVKGDVFFGDYVSYLRQVEEFIKENPSHPLLNVSFEETKRDPVKVVRRLADLLQVNAAQQLCEEIAEACSFQKMKKVDDTLKEYLHTPGQVFDQKLYRKGEVGDWKNYLTVAESEMFDHYTAEGLKDCSLFNIQYEP